MRIAKSRRPEPGFRRGGAPMGVGGDGSNGFSRGALCLRATSSATPSSSRISCVSSHGGASQTDRTGGSQAAGAIQRGVVSAGWGGALISRTP